MEAVLKNSNHSDYKNASDDAVFFLFKTVYGPLGYTDDQIRSRFIAKRAARTGISPIPPTAKPNEREKLLAYCNGDSRLLAAAYENFTAEQISAFVKDFL